MYANCGDDVGLANRAHAIAAGTAEGVPSHKNSNSVTTVLRFGLHQSQWRQLANNGGPF